jgi:putative transposase
MISQSGKPFTIIFASWRKDGTWQRIHERLRLWVRVSQDREPSPSEAIMDSQSVETATMVSQEVGYDSGKKIKGRKRHILIDTLGLLIVVVITAANVSEQAGAKQVLFKLDQVRDRRTRRGFAHRLGRLIRIWVDGGYRGQNFANWVIDVYRACLERSYAAPTTERICCTSQTLAHL